MPCLPYFPAFSLKPEKSLNTLILESLYETIIHAYIQTDMSVCHSLRKRQTKVWSNAIEFSQNTDYDIHVPTFNSFAGMKCSCYISWAQ